MSSIAELERLAADCSQRGDAQSTERICKEILALDGKHLSSLRFLADRALQAGEFATAAEHLRVMIEISPGDMSLYSQLGQALYRMGKLPEAVAVYEDFLRMNPRKPMVFLTLGCLHVELGDIDKAAQLFSLGESIDGTLLALWKKPDTNPALAQMSKTAYDTLCRHHTELHLKAVQSVSEGADVARVRDAIWPLLDARECNYQHPQYKPQVFCIKHTEFPPFFARELFAWCEQLEAQFPVIREEILAGLDLAADGRPYLGDGHRLEGEQWQPLVNKLTWASVHLYSRGEPNEQVIAKFPRTLAALAQLPLAGRGDNPSEVFISVLAPHTRIPRHYGVSNAILTAHLPIEVPAGCGLQVHNETRTPEPGKLMLFDDTWQHSAWNDSDQQRVVLIFELWHPGLTDLEKRAISRSFGAREQWLRQRKPLVSRA